jgi:hypothetical protein
MMKRKVIKAFKYRGEFKRDLDAIKNYQIYASNKEQLNDPCEMLTDDQAFLQLLHSIERNYGISSKKIKSEFASFKERILNAGVFSLSLTNEPLNILLWSMYANSHKGFCIEYDLDILTKYNNAVNKFWIKYSNKIPVFKTNLFNGHDNEIIRHFTGYKSKDWKYENEYRLLYDNFGFQDVEYKAVKSIYFGYKMDSREKDTMFENLQGRGIKYFQIKLLPGKYKLYCEKIKDPYQHIKKEIKVNKKKNIIELIEIAKTEVGNELSNYLRKAINLVSNYPGVNNILDAEIKFDKSTPVIKVVYQKKEYRTKMNLPKVYQFTKEEIDAEYKDVIETEA